MPGEGNARLHPSLPGKCNVTGSLSLIISDPLTFRANILINSHPKLLNNEIDLF